jgi:AAA domain (dynein-related subfamily)
MSKHKKNQHRQSGQGSPAPRAPMTPGDASRKASELMNEALREANSEDLGALPPSTGASTDDGNAFASAYSEACNARDLFRAQTKRLEKTLRSAEMARAEVERKGNELEGKEQGLRERDAFLKEQLAATAALEKAQQAREASIVEREEAILQREIDADAGFAARRRESLRALDEEAHVLNQQLSRARADIAAERAAWGDEAREARAKLIEELSAQRAESLRQQQGKTDDERAAVQQERDVLEAERHALEAARSEMESGKRRLAMEREDLEERRQELEDRARQKAAGREERLQLEIAAVSARLDEARAAYSELDRRMQARDAADASFGGQTPGEVFAKVTVLTRERDELRAALANRPGVEAVERLQALESERGHWSDERSRMSLEIVSLKADLARFRIAVTELETLRDQKAALESGRDLMHAALEELRKDVGERISRNDNRSPFPSCSEMDRNPELQDPQDLTEKIADLPSFVSDLRQRIALDPSTGKQLFYSLRDLRCFLGGLAMSRLHLLQGMSGTGKTSLPLAFARAIGAGSAVVEVQAGWRDRQDLVGHFNAFERKFYESEFLQALYRAQCPRYDNVPFVILLDEMNLSHPEQYFADMLSALEQDPDRQKLDLMTAPVDGAPVLLRDRRTLAIPANVWFIGTANHDETTKDFADKTYDRAHVMELPRHRERFEPKPTSSRLPVSLSALMAAFQGAQAKHAAAAGAAYEFLDRAFADVLASRFRVGWGNRLQRQVEAYVPVVVASGGTVGEATDQILATKILRKIRDRHDTRPEDLLRLKEPLEDAVWRQLDAGSRPERSLEIIEQEIRRLGGDQD